MVANSEMLFRTKSQQIRDSIDRHEKMVVSFGPNINTNPSPSDPVIKSELVTKIVDDLRRENVCPKVKTMYLGKLVLACLCRNQAKECFGAHTRCDLLTHGSEFFGRFLTANQDGFYSLFFAEYKTKGMPYGLYLKIFDGDSHFLESDGVGGETVLSVRFQYPQTLSKVVSYIYAKMGVAVGLEEILPIRGDTRIIQSIDDFSLSSEIKDRQKQEAEAEAEAQEQENQPAKSEHIPKHSFVA
ncbi:MAG: hypothetical protein ACOCUH_01870 [Bacteriovoracia bacterium]